MRERWIVTMLGAAWLSTSSASADVVTLAALEERALEKHTRLSAGALRVRAADAELRQAASAYRPRVGLSVDANAAPGRVLRSQGNGFYAQGVRSLEDGARQWEAIMPRPRVGAGVQLDAYLYDFGRTHAAVQAGQAKRRAVQADGELERAQVIATVRGAYLGWLSAHQLHTLAATASSDAARRTERVAALIQEGARPRTDLPPIDADRLLSELERERAEGELASARLTLEQSVGEQLSPSAEPDPELLQAPFPEATTSPSPDPALAVLAQQRRAMLANARFQRKQRAPLLSTSIGAGVYGQLTQSTDPDPKFGFRPFPSYSLGLALTVPLWDGGSSKAGAEAAEANAAELGLRMESAERERAEERERARLEAEHADKRRALAEQLLIVCKIRVEDAEAGYELGAMQFDQVQQARALMRRAETELVMAKVAHAAAVLRALP